MTNQEIALQRRAARLVEREVHACMSSLVATLASGGIAETRDAALSGLIAQATELTFSTCDYESAAREAGWSKTEGGTWVWDGQTGDPEWDTADTAELACQASDIEPHELEVFEHWAVSTWLADKLEAKGERVDRDFAGLIVWARTTTGQAISMDSVIEAIVSETGYASGGEA